MAKPTRAARATAARATATTTVQALRRAMSRKAADLIRSDPDTAATALEVGLVDRQWLDDPAAHPISSGTPTAVLERFLERSVEQRPSRLAELGLSAVQLLSSSEGKDDGESRPVTVVFTDLEGFTAFTAEHGDAAASAMVQDHRRAVGPIVRSWHGRVVKQLGDGFLLSFAEPKPGVLAALELLGTCTAPLRLRAGVHVGEAVVSRADLVGHAVNVAARVTEIARGGQALATTDVRDTVKGVPGVHFGKARTHKLKGVSDRIGLCEITLAGA
jgi:adenylate cyclase